MADEAQLAERVERQFPELFVARARQIALVILDQNQTDVLRESNRYVVSQSTATGAPPPEVDGLRQADRSWSPGRRRPLAERLKGMTQEANQNVSGEELTALETDVRGQAGGAGDQAAGARRPLPHPAASGLHPRRLHGPPGRSRGAGHRRATTRLLKNISDTRAGIEQDTIHVWDLNFVPELTYQSRTSPLPPPCTAIARHAEGKRTAEALLSVALGVVAVGAGVALFSALGVGTAAVVLGAPRRGGSLYQLLKDVDSYLREEAAGLALDPQLRDLSQKEPELLPIALDLVFGSGSTPARGQRPGPYPACPGAPDGSRRRRPPRGRAHPGLRRPRQRHHPPPAGRGPGPAHRRSAGGAGGGRPAHRAPGRRRAGGRRGRQRAPPERRCQASLEAGHRPPDGRPADEALRTEPRENHGRAGGPAAPGPGLPGGALRPDCTA